MGGGKGGAGRARIVYPAFGYFGILERGLGTNLLTVRWKARLQATQEPGDSFYPEPWADPKSIHLRPLQSTAQEYQNPDLEASTFRILPGVWVGASLLDSNPSIEAECRCSAIPKEPKKAPSRPNSSPMRA